MRVTLHLDDDLLRRMKREAQRRGKTLTSMIEQGVRLVLGASPPHLLRKGVKLPVSITKGGVGHGVDLDDSADLLDHMEGRLQTRIKDYY